MPTTFVDDLVDGDVIEASYTNQYGVPINDIESGETFFPAVSGTANAIVVTFPVANVIPALTAGFFMNFVATAANTAATTIQVNSLTAVAVKRPDGTPLQPGDIPAAGCIVRVVFDGTNFQIAQLPPDYYPAVSGTANAIVVTFPASTVLPALVAGFFFNFKATAANTGATTLQVNSLTAVAVTRPDGTALQAGDIQAVGAIVRVVFDGSAFQIAQTPAPAVTLPTPLFGSGSDGNVTITSNTTLTRDMQYNNLTINGGVVVSQAGFMIRTAGTLTNNGTLANNGTAGSNGAGNVTGQPGGAGAPGSTFGGGATGGAGGPMAGNGVIGNPGDAGANGGTGGNGHVTTGGTGLLNSDKLVNWARVMLGQSWLQPNLANLLLGGSGGGGGGGSANHGAPGGGGGGGVILVAARHVAGTGAVQVQGGAGGAGAASNNVGGGGGGGAGVAIVITGDASCSWSLSATGGAGGAPTGTGTAGTAGSNGFTQVIPNSVEV